MDNLDRHATTTEAKFSQSEEDGLSLLFDSDLSILSVGISTGGAAEQRMLANNANRRIVATTLDKDGAELVRQKINGEGMGARINVRIENIADPSQGHEQQAYDYIYARLVLHYLTKQELPVALKNMVDALKPGGRIFVVVRSVDCDEAQPENVVDYDPITEMTTYKVPSGQQTSRRFHTQNSITEAIQSAGLKVDMIKQFDEDLSPGFNRDSGVWIKNNLIEVVAHKE